MSIMRDHLPLIGAPLAADAEVLVHRVPHVAVQTKAFSCTQKTTHLLLSSLFNSMENSLSSSSFSPAMRAIPNMNSPALTT